MQELSIDEIDEVNGGMALLVAILLGIGLAMLEAAASTSGF